MTKECELLGTCGFFRKYELTKEATCRGFISTFCKGDLMDQCRRKQIKKDTGKSPSDDMMPTGLMVSGTR